MFGKSETMDKKMKYIKVLEKGSTLIQINIYSSETQPERSSQNMNPVMPFPLKELFSGLSSYKRYKIS